MSQDRSGPLLGGGRGNSPQALDPPGVGALEDRSGLRPVLGGRGRGGFGIPAMAFEAAENLVGQPDGAEGVVAADPGTR